MAGYKCPKCGRIGSREFYRSKVITQRKCNHCGRTFTKRLKGK